MPGALNLFQQTSAVHTFTISCDHPAIRSLIERVQEQGIVYYRALDKSIQVVEDGYAFSVDSEELCGFLLDPHYTEKELQEFVSSMRDFAKQAHSDAKTTVDMFRSVRQGLNEVFLKHAHVYLITLLTRLFLHIDRKVHTYRSRYT